jgi:hypothetical protein
MTYSDSTHFSNKISYKILFIPSYELKDRNFAKFDKLQVFSGNKNEAEIFLTEREPLTGGARLSDWICKNIRDFTPQTNDSNLGSVSVERKQATDQLG